MKEAELVASVMAETPAALRAGRDAQRRADLVELRLDALAVPDVAAALADRHTRVIVTCRPEWEGGRFTGSEDQRVAVLRKALAMGAEFVDIEWRAEAAAEVCADQADRVVLSMHDFNGVPGDLAERLRSMLAMGSRIVKVAVAPHSLRELVAAARVVRQAGADNVVLIGMGAVGFPSRVLPSRFGSIWTYCGDAVAPGQVPPDRLIDEFRFGQVSGASAVYGVVGRPIMHSLSPALHNAAFGAVGLDAVYLPFEASDWADFEALAGYLDVAGCSVTAPFKRDALLASADIDAVSRQVGAVNTLRRAPENLWRGMNSDVQGLLAPLGGERLQGARVAILGAGGAARAACVAMRQAGGCVTVHARRPEQARAVAEALDVAVGEFPPAAGTWDVLINATPKGTWPDVDESPLPAESLSMSGASSRGLVYDLVYNPEQTRLLRDAGAAGCRTLGGLDMLVAQAAVQFHWWTGRTPPVDVMAAAARRRLAARQAARSGTA